MYFGPLVDIYFFRIFFSAGLVVKIRKNGGWEGENKNFFENWNIDDKSFILGKIPWIYSISLPESPLWHPSPGVAPQPPNSEFMQGRRYGCRIRINQPSWIRIQSQNFGWVLLNTSMWSTFLQYSESPSPDSRIWKKFNKKLNFYWTTLKMSTPTQRHLRTPLPTLKRYLVIFGFFVNF